jgi:hypothetical protein
LVPLVVVRLRDEESRSWRSIAAELNISVMTAVAAYRRLQAEFECTETAPEKISVQLSSILGTDWSHLVPKGIVPRSGRDGYGLSAWTRC